MTVRPTAATLTPNEFRVASMVFRRRTKSVPMILTRPDKAAACLTCRYPVIVILTMRGIVIYHYRGVQQTHYFISNAIHKTGRAVSLRGWADSVRACLASAYVRT
jgi:hypothetical protein